MSEVKESGEVSTSATWRFFGSLFFGREGEGEAGSAELANSRFLQRGVYADS